MGERKGNEIDVRIFPHFIILVCMNAFIYIHT